MDQEHFPPENNIITFPGAKIDSRKSKAIHQLNEDLLNPKAGLTELEWEELEKQNLIFSGNPDSSRDIAYELAFKSKANFDIANIYHRPRFAQDFSLDEGLQSAFQKLEMQFNQWDYLIRKIAYYKRS